MSQGEHRKAGGESTTASETCEGSQSMELLSTASAWITEKLGDNL